MFPVGGVGIMLLGALLAALPAAVLAAGLRHRLGWVAALSVAGLLWSLVVVALVTLIPAEGAPGYVPADARLDGCSWDVGGPAPEGFWVFESGQRALNTALFVPSGALLVLAVMGVAGRRAWVLVPVGLGLLALCSAGIEGTQLALARLDRACDVTDVVDNVAGAGIGLLLGLALAPVLRPWRRPDRRHVR